MSHTNRCRSLSERISATARRSGWLAQGGVSSAVTVSLLGVSRGVAPVAAHPVGRPREVSTLPAGSDSPAGLCPAGAARRRRSAAVSTRSRTSAATGPNRSASSWCRSSRSASSAVTTATNREAAGGSRQRTSAGSAGSFVVGALLPWPRAARSRAANATTRAVTAVMHATTLSTSTESAHNGAKGRFALDPSPLCPRARSQPAVLCSRSERPCGNVSATVSGLDGLACSWARSFRCWGY